MPANLPSICTSQSTGVVSDFTARPTDSPWAIDKARPSSPVARALINTIVSGGTLLAAGASDVAAEAFAALAALAVVVFTRLTVVFGLILLVPIACSAVK